MKKLLLIGSIILTLGLLIVGTTTPIFAHGPDDSEATAAEEETWEAMHEACERGDWDAMAETFKQIHGDSMPYHDKSYGHDSDNHWDGMERHMGSTNEGMMSW